MKRLKQIEKELVAVRVRYTVLQRLALSFASLLWIKQEILENRGMTVMGAPQAFQIDFEQFKKICEGLVREKIIKIAKDNIEPCPKFYDALTDAEARVSELHDEYDEASVDVKASLKYLRDA